VTAVVEAGLGVERLEEYPGHFWGQFPEVGPEEMGRIPHTFALVARRDSKP
jgi:hypothetical protein